MSSVISVSVMILSPLHHHSPHHVTAELIRQFLLHLFDLAGLAVVPQSPGHLLIGHHLAVALLLAPSAGESLLVFGGELKDASFSVHPPDAVPHVSVLKKVQEELIEAHFPFVSCRS